MNNNNNIIMASLRNTEAKMKKENENIVPVGYIPIQLSTKGKLGAPKLFHIRNFKTKDIISLSLTEPVDLPQRLISILNDMIFEDVDVASWHEKEVEELMVYVYMTFFSPTIQDVNFTLNQSDRDYLIKNGKEDLLQDIDNKKWVPKFNINIASDVETFDLDDNFKSDITITNKKTGFYVTFSYIKYGDQLIIKKWLDDYFSADEKKFDKIKKTIDFNNSLQLKMYDDPSLVDKMITIDQNDLNEYNEYINRKLEVLTEVVKIISVVNYNGQDVSNMSLSDKYELLSNDARIDVGLISKLTARQNKNMFGIKPEIKVKNPITGGVESRPFTFPVSLIISAIQLSGYDDYDDGYDD